MDNIEMIRTYDLFPHPQNPRKDLGDLDELVDSIKANGVLQNLTVVPRDGGGYTVIIGHRRLAAARRAGLTELPCAVTYMTEEEQFALLAADGMLVKRPVLVGDDFVLTGFRQAEWEEKLK